MSAYLQNTNILSGEISAENLSVVFNGEKQVTAIENLSFKIQPGEFVTFLGTSGCGKSTILNTIAGFVKPSTGKVSLDNKLIQQPQPEIGIVFQHCALFPWKTVQGNIELGPKIKGKNQSERDKLVNNFLKLFGLDGLNDRYPHELSGGMAQRVAVARALANNPAVLLMDEPFGSLDSQTRIIMQELILKSREDFHKTIIFVTHDVDEAILLSDRILVLTALPGHIKEEIRVDLPKIGSYEKIVTSNEFITIKKRVLELIREETDKIFKNV